MGWANFVGIYQKANQIIQLHSNMYISEMYLPLVYSVLKITLRFKAASSRQKVISN